MKNLQYIDRTSGEIKTEKVYGSIFIDFLYHPKTYMRYLARPFLFLMSRLAFFSKWYGGFQKSRWSQHKVSRFIRKYQVDTSEFLEPVQTFHCFNDFFIRKLRPECRPITPGEQKAILPADARYFAFETISAFDNFFVKGHRFCLRSFLQNDLLAETYAKGSLVIARLAPVDYHRFHFPVPCVPSETHLIPGPLYSVNPRALRWNPNILCKNKRMLTFLETKAFGMVVCIEIGATYVGSIHQTFTPYESYEKGHEKGFFSFGGSCIILLFEPFTIALEPDLLQASRKNLEVLGHMGQLLGSSISH